MANSSLQKSPTTISLSTPDLSKGYLAHTNPRKRRLFDGEGDNSNLAEKGSQLWNSLEEWKSEIQASIINTIKSSVQISIGDEISKISSSISTLQSEIKNLSTNLQTMNNSMADINTRVSDLEKHANYMEDLSTIPSEIKSLKSNYDTQINNLKTQNYSLQKRLDDSDQFSRQSNIEIRNLPERKNENLTGILENLGKIIKLPIHPSDIVFAHRVPHAHKQADGQKQVPKNVVVKFHSRTLRDSVIAASKQHRGGIDAEQLQLSGSSKIYINEHLTLQKKNLFRQTKQRSADKKYKYVWIKNAAIMARKEDASPVLFIKTEMDLDKII